VNRSFLYGVAVGALGVWAYHRFVNPMKSNKGGAAGQ
jgi:hypothetical protein